MPTATPTAATSAATIARRLKDEGRFLAGIDVTGGEHVSHTVDLCAAPASQVRTLHGVVCSVFPRYLVHGTHGVVCVWLGASAASLVVWGVGCCFSGLGCRLLL